ncbi:14467_t:CDS:2, partial [Ambispora leptoticha]
MLPTTQETPVPSLEPSSPMITNKIKRKLDFSLPSPPTISPRELVAKLIERGDKNIRMPNEFFIYRAAIVKELKVRGERIKMTEVSAMASDAWKLANRKEKNQYRKLAQKINNPSKKNQNMQLAVSPSVPSSCTQHQNQIPTTSVNELMSIQTPNFVPSFPLLSYNSLPEHYESQFPSCFSQFLSSDFELNFQENSSLTDSNTPNEPLAEIQRRWNEPIVQYSNFITTLPTRSQDTVDVYTHTFAEFNQNQLQLQPSFEFDTTANEALDPNVNSNDSFVNFE